MAACDDQVVGTRTSSPGPGGSCGPANAADDLGDEAFSTGNSDRRIQVSKTRHRCGDDRTTDAKELTRLYRVETLGERRDLMGNDHHVRVLKVGRQLGVWTMTEDEAPASVKAWVEPRVMRVRAHQHETSHRHRWRLQMDRQRSISSRPSLRVP